MRIQYFIFALSVVIIIGCEDPGYCTLSVDPGIIVFFKNDNGVIEGDITAIAFDDNFIDTLNIDKNELGQVVLQGVYERAGVYSMLIESDFYKTYTDTNIIVMSGRCHVRTVKFEVILERK